MHMYIYLSLHTYMLMTKTLIHLHLGHLCLFIHREEHYVYIECPEVELYVYSAFT